MTDTIVVTPPTPVEITVATGTVGPQGPTGATGAAGTNGVGVPAGGTTGQVLAKIDGTNYNTQWVAASTGSGTVTSIATTSPLTGGTITSTGTLGLNQSLLAIANTQVSGLGTASTKDIPATGNASATQVVYGSDTRLTDSRTPTTHAATHASGGGDAITIAESQVTNLVTDLAAKAPLASPALTGTPTVPTATADTNSTQAASTAFVIGQAGTATPIVDGTAAVGTSNRFARQDHVHPTDTSRAPLTSPSFTTPTLGVASATSINKVGITSPATGSTLTIADGKTFTANNTLTFSGTDSSTLNIGTGGTLGTGAFATIANYAPLSSPSFTTPSLGVATATSINGTTIPSSATLYGSTSTVSVATTSTAASGVGYMGLPQNATTTGSYTIVAADAGTHIYASATRTVTIPANSSVAFPIGTTLTFIAGTGATMTIAITTDTMYLAGAGTTGSRTLAAFGMATAVKITSTSWMISGNGLT